MKQSALFITFFWLTFAAAVRADEFKVPLRISDGLGEFDTLWFGVNPNATYCIDESLGEYDMYPPPPSGIYVKFVDTRLGSNRCMDMGLKLDLRKYVSSTQVDSYQVSFGGEYNFPYSLSWPDLRSIYTNPVWLRNDYAGTKVNVDMKEQNSFVLPESLGLSKLLIITGDPVAGSPTAPSDLAAEFSRFDQTSATIIGRANPNGSPTTAWFEWGTTISYGNTTAAQPIGSGYNMVWMTKDLTGLAPKTAYHFRIAAQNIADTTFGDDHSFSTLADGIIGTNLLRVGISDDGGQHATLWFGVHPDATNCIDDSLGEYELYPMPPDGLDARLVIPCSGISANADFRHLEDSAQSDVYKIRFQPGTDNSGLYQYPMTFSWPDVHLWFNGSIRMIDPYGGLGVNIDMKGQSSLVLPESLGLYSLLIITGTPPAQPPLPSVLTSQPNVAGANVLLRGAINPNGFVTDVWFEWGTTDSYGTITPPNQIGNGVSVVSVTEGISGVASGTKYHYRVVAHNANGTMNGPDRSFTASGVTVVVPGDLVPGGVQLYQNYPNPFNPLTGIRYQITERSYVTLEIYNMLGQEVARLVDEMQDPGFKSIEWEAKNVPSGVYFYRLIAGIHADIKRMLLLK